MSRQPYRPQVLQVDPPRCSICGICKRNYPGIPMTEVDGSDQLVCLLCVREAARGAKMTGDGEPSRSESKRRWWAKRRASVR